TMEVELLASGIADRNRDFNLTWHDWLNLQSQIEVSKVIALAALQRENSRGAHYRDDFKDAGDLATSAYTVVRQQGGKLNVTNEPVKFTHVRPGETLLKETQAAE
ncbi:MAG: succinate dehydrogenase/fumarate reductase flavoprotein subunit, partial [Hyphomicrobium sp.]|nr:succinate dehydrogenase/fumarate reductase flavoprotein subunit [Hyphomicrobium sp.]